MDITSLELLYIERVRKAAEKEPGGLEFQFAALDALDVLGREIDRQHENKKTT